MLFTKYKSTTFYTQDGKIYAENKPWDSKRSRILEVMEIPPARPVEFSLSIPNSTTQSHLEQILSSEILLNSDLRIILTSITKQEELSKLRKLNIEQTRINYFDLEQQRYGLSAKLIADNLGRNSGIMILYEKPKIITTHTELLLATG